MIYFDKVILTKLSVQRRTELDVVGITLFFFLSIYQIPRLLREHSKWRLVIHLLAIFLYICVTVYTFSGAYHELGIINGTERTVKDKSICIYFSIVTFTTLGYGDFHPTEAARELAAVEALIGYICMGVLVATIFFILTQQNREYLSS